VPIAIAVMAKDPHAGDVKTRLAPRLGPDERALVYCAFLRDKLAQVRQVSEADPVVAYTPRASEPWFRQLVGPDVRLIAQCEGSLGARVIAAFDTLLDLHPEGVILTDSDTPDLPSDHLGEAVRALATGAPLVIGPTHDGGYYLIGLARRAPAMFEGVAWSTEQTRAQTLEGAAKLGMTAHLLPSWHDVDHPEDLARLERSLARDGGRSAPHTWAALARIARSAAR